MTMLIIFWMREEVYRTWVKIALWLLAISMVLILLAPNAQTGGFGPQISFGKPDVALFTSATLVIVSVITIGWKYWTL